MSLLYVDACLKLFSFLFSVSAHDHLFNSHSSKALNHYEGELELSLKNRFTHIFFISLVHPH